MLAQSPRLQFFTGLLDFPKSKAKEVILVRGPWNETSSSPDLSFFCKSINVFPRCVVCVLLHAYFMCARALLLCVACAGKNRRGKLVNWVEKASFEKIQKLLEISERERHHEVLITL